MLIIKNVSIYLTKDLRILLDGLNLSITPGMKLALIGEEGNGKSTLLKAIADPDSILDYAQVEGEIYRGDEILGFLPQEVSQGDLQMTTKAFIDSRNSQDHRDYGRYYELLASMGLSEDRISEDILLGELSGGEKIKLQLLTILLQNPTVLLLDEPTNDLDLESIQWLEGLIQRLPIPLLFISHDEQLLENCANAILHMEQLMRKSLPKHNLVNMKYSDYLINRSEKIERLTRIAKKQREELDQKLDRYRKIYQKVERDQRNITRQDPTMGKHLKDKMHTIKAMGRRFEKEEQSLTKKPDYEDSILVRFDEGVQIPRGKRVLDFSLEELTIGELVLSRDIHLEIIGPQKICILGRNGAGKTTILKRILRELDHSGIPYGYMPQDYRDQMRPEESAVDFLATSGTKEEITKVRTYLGSMNFTAEEMHHPICELSGGQRAKLYFSKMILEQSQVLVLDEPTRNLSPLSGPEIRAALRGFGGAIIAVTHDRKLVDEVFDEIYYLKKSGLTRIIRKQI